MFTLLLVAVLLAAGIHIVLAGVRRPQRIGELGLLYLLVGYCGLPLLAFGVISLVWPDRMAAHLGFAAGNPFQHFSSVAVVAMSLMATLSLWYGGVFLIGPAACWAIFFAGATVVHLSDYGARGALTHGSALAIFLTHGLISVLLVVALLMSGLLKDRGVRSS